MRSGPRRFNAEGPVVMNPATRPRDMRFFSSGPTELSEGTVIALHVADDGDDLTDGEPEALHGALDAAWQSVQAGDVLPASALLEATS